MESSDHPQEVWHKRAERLLAADRYGQMPPEMILDQLGCVEGSVCMDIGCGNGFFTIPMAKRVCPSGRVYAVDVDQRMLDLLQDRAVEHDVHRSIEYVLSTTHTIPLRDSAADLGLISQVLHGSGDPEGLFREVVRIVSPAGRLMVIEWAYTETDHGPELSRRIAPRWFKERENDLPVRLVEQISIHEDYAIYVFTKETTSHG